MPDYKFQAPDGRDFTLRGDSPPTEQELEDAYASLPPIKATPKAAAISPEQQFAKRYISEQQASLPSKLSSAIGTAAGIVPSLIGTVKGGIQGLGSILGEATSGIATPTGTDFSSLQNLAPNLAQTAVESGSRLAYDIANAIRQGGQYVADEPIESALRTNPAGVIASMLPRTPNAEEISKAFQRELTNQAFQQVRQQPIAEPILGTANIPLAEALPLVAPTASLVGKIVPKVAGAIESAGETMASRGFFSAPLEDAVTKATGITAQEGAGQIVPIAKTRILEAVKDVPANARQAFEAAGKTEKYLIDKTVNVLKQADEQGLQMSKVNVLKNAEDNLKAAQPSITQEEIDAALKTFKDKLPDVITPSEGQKFLVEQNDALQNVFNETGVPARKTRGNAAITARLGVADSLSNQLDDIYKAVSGLDESPYRDWGQVREFKNGLNDQIISAQSIQGGKAGKGIPSIPTSSYSIKHAAVNLGARPFVPRLIEAVDKGVKRIFKEVPSVSEAVQLDRAAQDALIQKYTPGTASAAFPAIPPPLDPNIVALRRSKTYKEANPTSRAALEKAIERSLSGEAP